MATVDNELPEKLSHNHPLFLNTIDNSGVLLSSIQLTGADNYSVWSRALKIAIIGRNKLGFIDGSRKKEAYGPNLVNLWERCNAIVLSWIMNCVSKELLGGIVYSTNVASVWKDLAERYDKVDGSRIFQLHKEIATVSQGTSSISTYFSRLRELWVEYDSLTPVPSCECVNSREFVKFVHNQKLLQFLMGLNDSYDQARGHILMMIPLPSLNKTYSILIERESQRTMSQVSSSANCSELNAMFTSGNNTNAMVPRSRPYNNSSYYPNAFCDYCKRTGHTQAVCYQLHGFPPGFERKKKNPNNTYQGRGRSSNEYHGRGRFNNDRRQNITAHNAVSDGDIGENSRSQGYGRGSINIEHVEYQKGMTMLHEQYNQILHMLGQTNMQQENSEGASTSHYNANVVQAKCSSAGESAGNEAALIVTSIKNGWFLQYNFSKHSKECSSYS